LLLPLLAGGGWEGVKLLMNFGSIKSDPTPALPYKAGEGESASTFLQLHLQPDHHHASA